MQDLVIFGASGYTGLELLRLLAHHPSAQVVGASSDRWAQKQVSDQLPGVCRGLKFVGHDALMSEVSAGQIAFLATPAPTSAALAPQLLDKGLRVIDLSGGFRLRAEDYPTWYGFDHPAPALLKKAHYGMAEIFAMPKNTSLVANPGCYATAATLALWPLLKADGVIEPGTPIIVDGKSGTTGAGRKLADGMLFSEAADNLRPYRMTGHQHTPEIEQTLEQATKKSVRIGFNAHLIPMRRGLMASAYATGAPGLTQERVDEVMQAAYQDKAFVSYAPGIPPETGRALGNNFTLVSSFLDARTQMLSSFAAIDNLVKGAAGQAIQNLNAMLGLTDSTGLSS